MKPPIRTLWWEKSALCIIDQSALPHREKILRLTTVEAVWRAIRELKVRGAPAIGVAAGYGLAIAARRSTARSPEAFRADMTKAIRFLASCRPTAYNLFFALRTMEETVFKHADRPVARLKKDFLAAAAAFHRDDLERGQKIGLAGAPLIKNNMGILTHCNAGGLATAGFGTALAPLFVAQRNGRKFSVFVDETRPILQGARLTAYELEKTGIPHTLICDNMAASLMKQGKIGLVIVGADRIAANGDTANKIGTYGVAVLAQHHRIPFYVAAPRSTFDFTMPDGDAIPIEERHPDEVRRIRSVLVASKTVPVFNPAFDVTPASLITGFITENGIIHPPFSETLRRMETKVKS